MAYGNQDIKLLFEAYKGFYDNDTTVADVLEHWADIKMCIVSSPGLFSLGFHELWSRMLVHYTKEYLLVLRLIVFMLLLPCPV